MSVVTPPSRAEHVALAAVFFANGAGFASWVSRIPAVREALALSEGQLGTVLLALGAGALISFPLAGRGIALLGARGLTLATGFLYCFLLPHPVLASSLGLLAMSLMLLGMANGAMDVAMNALAVEVEARQQRPIMSGLHGMWSAGGLAGATLGGGMAHLGVSPKLHLMGVAVLLAVTVFVARRWLPATPPKPPEPGPRFARPEAGMVGLGIIVFCAFLIEGAMADWSAVYLHDSLGTTAALAALGYAAFAFAMTGMRFAGDHLIAKWRASSLLRGVNASAAVLLAIALWTQHTTLLFVAFVVTGVGVATIAPLVFGAAARRSRRGPGHGIAAMATLGYGGFLLGPPVIGWLAQVTDLRTGLLVLVALAAAIAMLTHHLDESQPVASGEPATV